jgi:hypothetical protein
LVAVFTGRAIDGQAPAPAASLAALPPVSWTCPMHPEIVEGAKGTCPICKMDLTPIRLDNVWSCPIHPIIAEPREGLCPLDRRPLVSMTMELWWGCERDPKVHSHEPGACPDGSPRTARRTPRAHGDHNPKHGGQFFMASDNWHHLEGVWPEQGTFRVYFYDDYSKPLAADRLRQVAGRIVTKEAPADGTGDPKELEAFPLEPSPDGQAFLLARIGTLPTPAEITAKIKLRPDADEQRFDFVFAGFSTESESAPAAGGMVALEPTPIPETAAGVIASLHDQDRELKQLVEGGQFGLLYVTAFRARDLALALEAHAAALPADRRVRAEAAVTRMVQAAWLLDAAGDLGNRAQVVAAYARFTAGLTEAAAQFGSGR